jgi:hypothetical protein
LEERGQRRNSRAQFVHHQRTNCLSTTRKHSFSSLRQPHPQGLPRPHSHLRRRRDDKEPSTHAIPKRHNLQANNSEVKRYLLGRGQGSPHKLQPFFPRLLRRKKHNLQSRQRTPLKICPKILELVPRKKEVLRLEVMMHIYY